VLNGFFRREKHMQIINLQEEPGLQTGTVTGSSPARGRSRRVKQNPRRNQQRHPPVMASAIRVVSSIDLALAGPLARHDRAHGRT